MEYLIPVLLDGVQVTECVLSYCFTAERKSKSQINLHIGHLRAQRATNNTGLAQIWMHKHANTQRLSESQWQTIFKTSAVPLVVHLEKTCTGGQRQLTFSPFWKSVCPITFASIRINAAPWRPRRETRFQKQVKTRSRLLTPHWPMTSVYKTFPQWRTTPTLATGSKVF